MKRKIALLILMILALALALTACNQTASTAIRTRWDKNGETHVFNITLADFTEEGNGFNLYNADGQAVSNGGYAKDIAFPNTLNEFANWDEVRPIAVKGLYKITIQPSPDGSAYCDLNTVQQMCVVYNNSDISDVSKLSSAKATAEQMESCGLVDTFGSDVVILYSVTETSVRFENNLTQKPLSSSAKVNGFYVGKVSSNLTKYEISTVYNYDNKRPVATITAKNDKGEETVTEYNKFARNSAGSFIDSNQILMYLRSLSKSSNSFQDSPSKSVFNPYTQQMQTASFGVTSQDGSASLLRRVMLTRADSFLATNLNVVAVTIGNNNFMMQENLPDSLAEKGLDADYVGTELVSFFTTVRFRVGYLAYEIDYDNAENTANWNDIWTALAPVAEEE